jgi:hypothetical protein
MLELFVRFKDKLGPLLAWPLFIFYFFPFLVYFQAHVILWGVHSMAFGSTNDSPAAQIWGSVAFYGSLAIGLAAAIAWTALAVSRFSN